MPELAAYYQRTPNMLECLPDRIAKDPEQERARMEILDFLPPERFCEFDTILDLGSAGGWGIEELQRRYADATVEGLTLFQEEADALAERGLHAMVCDMHEMPAKWTGVFNLVYASHVLEHSPAPLIALTEIARVLQPGGTVMIVMPDPCGVIHPGSPERFAWMGDIEGHIFCASLETVIHLLRKVGLQFRSYHEVATHSLGKRCYWNRIWLGRKA